MRSYEWYVDLETIMSKIEKIVEPNSQITPGSLGEAWKKLPYLDWNSEQTKEQYKLVLNYTERLRSREGVVAISPGFKTTYFCSFLKNAAINKFPGQNPQQGNLGFFDMIYAYRHGIVALSYSEFENPVGHDGLADRMGIPCGDAREQYMVGGGVKYHEGKLITSELSGHYGHLWTDELRQGVTDLIAAATGLQVEHEISPKTLTVPSIKPVHHLQPYTVNHTSRFFSNKSDIQSDINQNNAHSRSACILL